jgi:hypothetical protein
MSGDDPLADAVLERRDSLFHFHGASSASTSVGNGGQELYPLCLDSRHILLDRLARIRM